ncbi:uncharacterized protein LOC143059218 [Mytilus galloprovincialis]|uniref:uncharacterized protein LOC143059218 n=1 Tax=Mytilus galloprovincialis TaxID=29158 RepID=UPI003F7CAB2A
METEQDELLFTAGPINTTRRDSGLDVGFDSISKTKLVRRDSGLDISDLDKFKKKQSRAKSHDSGNDDHGLSTTSISSIDDIDSRDSGSPVFSKTSPRKSELQAMENSIRKGKNETDSDKIPSSKENCKDIQIDDLENLEFTNSESQNVLEDESKSIVIGESEILSFELKYSENSENEKIPGDSEKTSKSGSVLLCRKKKVNSKGDAGLRTPLTSKPPRPESCRPSSVSRVSVSSRVDVMLNSDLFKKYLSKHENLIDKISLRQGRGAGMKKALSNLDLSQLDFDDDQSQEKKTNLISTFSFNDDKLKSEWENSPVTRTRRNTFCEYDYNRGEGSDKENTNILDNEKENDILRSSVDSSLSKQRTSSRKKFAIPSFHEFKMSKHFKEIPEEGPYDDEEQTSCENCDKNRTYVNEKPKSRSHSRCQRIKEKYFQNHEDQTLGSNNDVSGGNDSLHDLEAEDKSDASENSANVPKEKSKSARRSEIPIPVKFKSSSSPVSSPRQQKIIVDRNEIKKDHEKPQKSRILPKTPDESGNGLPPKHISEPKKRVVLRASRKRKMGQKKPFLRSQSDSQLKVDSAKHSGKSLEEVKMKFKPPPLEIKSVQSCETFSTYSPLFSASTFDSSSNPSSATVGSFDFSSDHVIKFNLGEQETPLKGGNTVLNTENLTTRGDNNLHLSNNSSKGDNLMDSTESNEPSANLRATHSESSTLNSETDNCESMSGKDNSEKFLPRNNSFDTILSQRNTFDSILSNNDAFNDIISKKDTFSPILSSNVIAGKITSGKDNSCDIQNVELWSDNSDKPIESSVPSSSSDCSDKVNDNSVSQNYSENRSSPTDCISDKVDNYLSQQNLQVEDDSKSSVTRSTSDVCNSTTSDALKKRRERKDRPYKSDPFTGSSHLPAGKPRTTSSSKNDIFETDEISLEEVEEEEGSIISEQEWEKERKKLHRLSDVSSDSGVIGPEYPPSPTSTVFSTGSSFVGADGNDMGTEISLLGRGLLYSDFSDCGGRSGPKSPRSPHSPRSPRKVNSGCKECGNYETNNRTKICSKCEKKSIERKDIIKEIKDTEESYGRDLAILKEHFFKPMKSAGLLSLEHLEGIFLNLEELIHVNTQFVKKLQGAVDIAVKKGDENLRTMSIGNLFLDSSSLILAFENYCVNQGQAAVLLEQLEREKELLRIFLKVSQDENPVLRRMPLTSFLMVPVQRIMRYPLLLERLYKFTSGDHTDKSSLMEAKLKIEDILDHINSKTKHSGTVKLKRKISENMSQRISITEKIEVNKVAIDILGWNRKEVCDIIISRLQVAPLSDQTWAAKRLKTMKFSTVHCVLLTLGQSDTDITDNDEDNLLFARKSKVIQAAVVLIKEKNGKYQTFREPFILNRCVVSIEPDVENAFELSDLSRDSYVFKGEDLKELKSFLQTVKQQTLNLASWRKRRNALPNIMIKHMV